MKRRGLATAVALASLVGLAGVLTVGAQDSTFPLTLTSVTVEGNQKIRSREILEAAGLSVGDVLRDQAQLQEASQAVFDLGWFGEVLPAIGDGGRLTFRVAENPVIERIVVRGNNYRKPFTIFGFELTRTQAMPTWKVKQILREHDIRAGSVPRARDLQAALEEVVQTYKDRGYILVMVGDVKLDSVLSIELIEGRLAGNRVSGLVTVPEDVALGMMSLPMYRPLMQSDLQEVMTRLTQSVYFEDVRVDPAQGPTRDSVYLDWTLTERMLLESPRAVSWVRVQGVTQFPRTVAQNEVGYVSGDAVDNYALLKALEGVQRLYRDAGFVMARPKLAGFDGDVALIEIEEGVVAEIVLETTSATRRRVLEKTLDIEVGRILTRHDLQVSYQALNALGYFRDILMEPEWGESGVRVVVGITDQSKLGGMNGSVAFEPTTGGIVGDLTVKQRNLFGTGQDVSLSYQRGMSPEGVLETSTWDLGYTTLATRTDFDRIALDLYRKTDLVKEDDAEKTVLTLGANVEFRYPIADYTDLAIAYRHDVERPLDVTTWSLVDAIVLSVDQDSSDDLLFPHRGARRVLSLEKAGGFAVGKEYAKLDATWIEFVPLYGDFLSRVERTFAVRLKLGFGGEGLSGAQAYQLGGPTSVRGAETRSVRSLALANAEYRLTLTDGLAVHAFLDLGVDPGTLRREDILASSGLEIAMLAAGVYVRLDVVWLLGRDASWVPTFEFGFGPMF
ncbi:MAG: POTRA domain-containing protein [Candidatus Bipolaricaulota bacterium]